MTPAKTPAKTPPKTPKRILFACTHNMIRSPMAEAMMKAYQGGAGVFVDSCGITEGSLDGFTIAVMKEIGIDLLAHEPKCFADLGDEDFDLIICFSQESHDHAVEFALGTKSVVEYWPVYDTGLTSERREEKLHAYRAVRDAIKARIERLIGGV